MSAASKLPINRLVTKQNTAVACWQLGPELRGTFFTVTFN